ncbi:hypothetical protein G4G28_05395 [Massilia sp. Dwa41.01b]|uniref:hypothetical protein n=1 Tax=unclassified Massilia TaxID=2609279 RepID=UPI0016031773|nr:MULTISPECIES: hypothetical protein [unclassified Massilia]QNA88060.1 hypothetical protein G4G28_05395 [Massilia sp. Dwa41.01b]QNA98966.1 hypothetical protein G4G31_09115 [Massilia sp. Se16.2.3]
MRTLEYEGPGISALAGDPDEVGRRLHQVDPKQAVAVAITHVTPREAAAIAETFASIADLVKTIVGKHHRASLEAIVEALVPKAPPTPNELREAAMLARARTAVIDSGDWMTAAEIASAAGFSTTNTSAQPNKWKRERSIFAIRHNGIDYFPSYGLDPQAGYRPRKALAQLIKTFGDTKDAWGLSYWFMSANSFLGGKAPRELIATDPERVIAAAADEVAGVAHG